MGRNYYIGHFENNKFHGYGTIKLKNGDFYSANWVHNYPEGQGVYTWANGNRAQINFDETGGYSFGHRIVFPKNDFRFEYRGETKDGNIMHGLGTLTLLEGMYSYTGEWADDKSTEHNLEMLGIEQGWQAKLEENEIKE